MSDTPKGGLVTYVKQSWLILLLSVIFGCALAGVELALRDKIKQNRLNKTKSGIPKFFKMAAIERATQIEVKGKGDEPSVKIWRIVDANDKLLGWLLPGRGAGYADVIELVVAVDAKCDRILGMSVLKQAETPALGDNIRKQPFKNNFAKGLTTFKNVTVVKGAVKANPKLNQIQAITGATVSSKSVVAIVNATITAFKPFIKKQGVK